MPLGILNNIPSLAAEKQLTLTNTALQTTLAQLSSGSRINTGADDAAGLAIANGLQANITALTQSVSNANNGVGELQLADGALAQVTTLLNRAVTLATESATGTVSEAQRTALQAEYSSILAEINRVGSGTTYNGQAVFQNGSSPNLNAQDSPTGGLTASSALTVGGVTTVKSAGNTFTYTAAAGVANPNVATSAGGGPYTAASALGVSGTLTITRGGVATTYTTGTGVTALSTLVSAINAGASQTGGGTIATTGVLVAGGAATGLQAAIVGGQLQITDTAGNNNLAVTGFAAVLTGTTSVADSTAPTVQNLINAINNDTTVGAKAVLTGGNLVITDPENRNNLVVNTTDTVLGAAVAGAPTGFPPPTPPEPPPPIPTSWSATPGLTPASVLTTGAITELTAGGKTFSFTAAAGNPIGTLLGAINNPLTDAAGLSAYVSGGDLVVVDPNNHGNLAVGATNTAV